MRTRAVSLIAVIAVIAALVVTPADRVDAQAPGSTRLRLGRDTVIAGLGCGPTGRAYLVVHPNGVVDECPLSRDSVVEGHALPKGTWIQQTPEALMFAAWLPRDVELQGVLCKGTGYKGWSVRFHPDGRLASCFLAKDREIDGVPCMGGSFLREMRGSTQVSLQANGRLYSCRVAYRVTIDGRTYPKGARFARQPSGTT